MEQSFDETAAASSPPKKKRGRPKKVDKVYKVQVPPSEATPVTVAKDVPKLRRKKKKGFSKSSAHNSHGKKKKHQQQQQGSSSSSKLPQSDGPPPISVQAAAPGATTAEKAESVPINVKVGQSVHGVVDGAFDAGYLVTVRVGDSDTVFRGVVFGPGLALPLNRENDVAPKMKRVPREEAPDAAASPGSPNEAATSVQAASVAGSPHAPPVVPTIPASPSVPPANETHRIAPMAGLPGMGYQAPVPAAPPSAATGSYTSPIFRSPSFAPGPMQNPAAGFYYAPAHGPSPSANHGPGGYYPPRAFPYPFHVPRAEYGASPQFMGSTALQSPSLPGSLPPRTS